MNCDFFIQDNNNGLIAYNSNDSTLWSIADGAYHIFDEIDYIYLYYVTLKDKMWVNYYNKNLYKFGKKPESYNWHNPTFEEFIRINDDKMKTDDLVDTIKLNHVYARRYRNFKCFKNYKKLLTNKFYCGII